MKTTRHKIIHVTEKDGTQYWYRDGKYHREDGPAAVYPDGTQYWYRSGNLHCEDGPAVIESDGTQEWYRNDKRHREDGPAVIYPDGSQYWCRNGELHREDGPAIIWPNGTQYWYRDGKKVEPFTAPPLKPTDELESRKQNASYVPPSGGAKTLRRDRAEPVDPATGIGSYPNG